MDTSTVALTGDSILARNAEIVVRRSETETVALDASRGLFFSLNESADFILGKLDGYATLAQVAQQVTEEFDVDADTALDAVIKAGAQLIEREFAHVIDVA